MAFLEADVQGSDHICHDLMDDLTAIEDESAESREFIGNAHSVVISSDGVTIECNMDDVAAPERVSDDTQKIDSGKAGPEKADPATAAAPVQYKTGLKHFREVLEDWEAFILDDQSPA